MQSAALLTLIFIIIHARGSPVAPREAGDVGLETVSPRPFTDCLVPGPFGVLRGIERGKYVTIACNSFAVRPNAGPLAVIADWVCGLFPASALSCSLPCCCGISCIYGVLSTPTSRMLRDKAPFSPVSRRRRQWSPRDRQFALVVVVCSFI